jgi:type VI protein secretion system component Hcp
MNRFLRILAVAVATAGAALAASAQGAIDYYLKIDGIDGGSTAAKYKGWSDVDSFSWGVSNSSGTPSASAFGWTQLIDQSVVPIMLGVANGTTFKNATFDVVQGGANPLRFFQMQFNGVNLSSLQLSGSAASLGFAAELLSPQITMTYWATDPKGNQAPPITGTWDLTKNSFVGDPNVLFGFALAEPTGFDLHNLPTAPVPEPQTWALFVVGLAMLTQAARRRCA